MVDPMHRLAAWAASTAWDDLPTSVRERSVMAMSDTVSVMVGGASTPAARIALDYARTAPGDSPLVGRGVEAIAAHAAFGNAVAASALDFDDGHYLAGAIHPGSVIIPAVLAAADSETTVGDALRAQVIGYEIGLRAAALLWPKHDLDHYHATGCAGALGAAAAAAALWGGDDDVIARAVTIAWLHAPMSTFGTPMVKESIGWGSSTGVVAAELARRGFMTVPPGYSVPENDVLPATPFHAPGAADDPFVTSIGTRFETEHTYFKSFAACRYTHAAGAGLLALLREHRLTAPDIARIRVGTHRSATFLDDPNPGTIEAAQYSFPFVLATLALHGAAGAPELHAETLAEPGRLDLASRITLEHDDDLDAHYPDRYPSRIDLETIAGEVVSGVFLDAPGDPGTDFGPTELRAKWERLLVPRLGEAATERLLAGLARPQDRVLEVLKPIWESV